MGSKLCKDQNTLSFSVQQSEYVPDNSIFNHNLLPPNIEYIKRNNLTLWKQKGSQKYFCGNFHEGKGQGIGVIYIPNHLYFQGNLRKGYPQGPGYINFMNRKQQYEGNFHRGMAHGKGKYRRYEESNSFSFEGQWADSQPTKGTLLPINNQIINLIQIQNFSSGNGSIVYNNGNVYSGQLNSYFEPHGQGTLRYNKTSKVAFYSGSWSKGKFHGEGNCQWKDESEYNGYYVNGLKQGQGNYRYPSGDTYEGQWKAGKAHGEGSIYDKNGKQFLRSIWVFGIPFKQLKNLPQQNKFLQFEQMPTIPNEMR